MRYTSLLDHAPVLLAAALVAACTSSDDVLDGPPTPPPGPITNTVLDRADALGLDTFAELARASSYRNLLETVAPLTVFAPDEAAFAALGATRLAELQDPTDAAARNLLVGRLVVGGAFDATLLENFNTLVTVGDDALVIESFGPAITVDAARVTAQDADADNGIVHVLDAVPEPPVSPMATLERAGLVTMAQLLTTAGLDAAVDAGRYAVLAPTEAAFAALPAGELDALQQPGALPELVARLETHLLVEARRAGVLLSAEDSLTEDGSRLFFAEGGPAGLLVNGRTLSRVNHPTTTGGFVHEIDAFLAAPPTVGEALLDPDLQVLDTLVFAASLGPALEATERLTLFAPTNAAFGALPAGTIDDLVMPANAGVLLTLLQSHALATARPAGSLADGDSLTTLAGSTIAVTDDGALLLDGIARIDEADVYLRNGVLHVVDAVLAADGL